MSATIYFQQVKPLDGTSLSCSWPSSFIESMKRAFYDFPCKLSEKDIPILRGLSAGNSGSENPYDELIEAIETYKDIQVYAVY